MYRNKFFYITDIILIILSLLFALLSFINADYTMGLVFTFIIPAVFLIAALLNGTRNRILGAFRLLYPQATYILFFNQSMHLSQLIYNGRSLDRFFSGLDQAIFGFQPAKEFFKALPDLRIIDELFFFAYFAFYAMMTIGWWVLYLRGKKAEAARAFFITTGAFAILYLFYSFFPVQGPKYYFPELYRNYRQNFSGYFFTSFMTKTFSTMNLAGAAFPSSHVAIATIVTALNLKYNKVLGFIFLPVTAVLYFSTVYIYAHYAVDVMGGVLTAGLLYMLLSYLYPRILRGAGNRGWHFADSSDYSTVRS